MYWGDLDVLLLDLPPGTGDIALSVAQLIPNSEVLVVTTPQAAAAEVAERAGQIAKATEQNVVGVIENMSYMTMPDGSENAIFGSGGGHTVAAQLSSCSATRFPCWAKSRWRQSSVKAAIPVCRGLSTKDLLPPRMSSARSLRPLLTVPAT